MTEDEARKKWCHRTLGTSEQCHCIVSDCMAWQWNTDKNNELARRLDPHNDGSRAQQIKDNKTGYCGLAGKP